MITTGESYFILYSKWGFKVPIAGAVRVIDLFDHKCTKYLFKSWIRFWDGLLQFYASGYDLDWFLNDFVSMTSS